MFRTNTLLLLIAWLLSGCTIKTPPHPSEPPINNNNASPTIALEVYRENADFYLKLKKEDKILFAGSQLRNHKAVEMQAQNFAQPSLSSLQYYLEQPWNSLPAEAINLPVFSIEKWHKLRDRLFKPVTPLDNTGLVIDFEHEEYFLFYDQLGNFQATRLQDKPHNYKIKGYLHFEKFIQSASQILDEFLIEENIKQTEFVFNTGDTGMYSLPFLYINKKDHLLLFFRNVPLQPVSILNIPGMKSGQTVGHLLRSHLTNIYTRPFSSLFRLMNVISDTAITTARFDWAAALSKAPVPPVSQSLPMDLKEWEDELDKTTQYPQTQGSISFLIDGEQFFTRFIDIASTAKKSVYLQTYIFDNDDYAIQIANLLTRRSNDGVDVKVLLDGLGTISATMSDSPSQPSSHTPPVSVHNYLEQDSQVVVRQKANPWLTGDHVKSTVIDNKVAFVGGMNIGREYRYDWHDLMMELHGPVVSLIEKEFLMAWSHAGPLGDLGYFIAQAKPIKEYNIENDYQTLRLLLTSPGNYEIYNTQLEAIRRSQSYIYLQNAYLTDDRLLRELVKARHRGVDVRVIIPLETDHGPITRSNVLAANAMLENGIRVFIYPGFSHIKAAIYDGWTCVGSANFDRLSFRINRELNISSSDPNISNQLIEKLFKPDFKHSLELTEPLPERWVDRLVELLGDYIY